MAVTTKVKLLKTGNYNITGLDAKAMECIEGKTVFISIPAAKVLVEAGWAEYVADDNADDAPEPGSNNEGGGDSDDGAMLGGDNAEITEALKATEKPWTQDGFSDKNAKKQKAAVLEFAEKTLKMEISDEFKAFDAPDMIKAVEKCIEALTAEEGDG